MISFVHIKNNLNIGDKYSCPLDYFKFENSASYDFNELIPKSRALVFGGGAILPQIDNFLKLNYELPNKIILWGVGYSLSNKKENPIIKNENNYLWGSREFGLKGDSYFVPCVSAMSNLFDKNYKVKNKFVIYEHAHIKKSKLSNVIKDFPVGNNRMDFKEAVAFLASGEYIITNSYHGTYWGILLNRKVICIPYSTKFNYFEFPPIYRSVENWNKNLEECNSYINALNVARYKNILFYRKVIKFLNN